MKVRDPAAAVRPAMDQCFGHHPYLYGSSSSDSDHIAGGTAAAADYVEIVDYLKHVEMPFCPPS
jgi:hypothetical protein